VAFTAPCGKCNARELRVVEKARLFVLHRHTRRTSTQIHTLCRATTSVFYWRENLFYCWLASESKSKHTRPPGYLHSGPVRLPGRECWLATHCDLYCIRMYVWRVDVDDAAPAWQMVCLRIKISHKRCESNADSENKNRLLRARCGLKIHLARRVFGTGASTRVLCLLALT